MFKDIKMDTMREHMETLSSENENLKQKQKQKNQ